ncbi:MAG: MFS transporter [Anaerolineae bacterium]|nr:MFS transporter [Anaerolineae bacterium]MCO5188043.1 MFS transporter [Anaerolineae bacterium]
MVSSAETSSRHDLTFIRAYYFVLIGGWGFLYPFLSVFYRRQGLSGTEIGIIGTTQAVAALVAAPLWGRWSDASGRVRRLLQISFLLTAILTLILGRQNLFWPIVTTALLITLAGAGQVPLSDTLALDIANRIPNVGYGSIRVYGSLGWALVTTFSGRLIELYGMFVGFVGNAAGMIASAVILFFLPRVSPGHQSQTDTIRPNWRQTARLLRQNRSLLGLAVAVSLASVAGIAVFQFEPIYLDELGASATLIGLASTIPAVVELGGMLWADRLSRRIGAMPLLQIALMLYMVRVIAILVSPTILTILAMRVVLGLGYSLYSVGIVNAIKVNSPPGQLAMMMALFTITLSNLAQIVGSPVAGAIFDAVGAYWLYAFALIAYVISWLGLRFGRKR